MSTSINIPCMSIAGKIAFLSQACLAGSTNKCYFYQQCTYIVLSCNAEISKQQQNFTNNSRNKQRYNCFQWCSLSRPRYIVIVYCHSLQMNPVQGDFYLSARRIQQNFIRISLLYCNCNYCIMPIYIYNTCALSKHIGNMCMRLRNGGKGEASPSLFPRFAPNLYLSCNFKS